VAKKKGKKRRAVAAYAKRGARRAKAAMDSKPGKVVVFAGEVGAGAVVSSLAVNRIPVIRDQGRMVKIGAQVGLGLAGLFLSRNKHVKALSAGSLVAAVMGGAREVLKLEPLAGPGPGSRTLTPAEMRSVTAGQLGKPVNYPGQLGKPVNYPGKLGDAFAPSLDAGGTGGWSTGF